MMTQMQTRIYALTTVSLKGMIAIVAARMEIHICQTDTETDIVVVEGTDATLGINSGNLCKGILRFSSDRAELDLAHQVTIILY
jgi:hypothetical protein